MVLDAGHIALDTDLANKEQIQALSSKRGQQYDDEDFRKLEGMMYDKLSLRLDSAQVSV